MKGVILDADSLGKVDLSPITGLFQDWQVFGTTSPDQTSERIFNANIVLSNKIVLDKDILKDSSAVQHISIMATGTNNVDLAAAKAANIIVSNAVAYATPSVVQHTINLMLALATNIAKYSQDVITGKWQKAGAFCMLDHPISELNGKTLGIVGHGELGSNVAAVARAFGMDVLIARGSGSANKDALPLEELLPVVDYLSLHCPLTDQTENMINKNSLKLMKPGAFLINTARGGLINTGDLLDALKSGIIAGAAIDVLNIEPPTVDEPLTNARLVNLIITPHNAWGSIESRQRLIVQMAENIKGFLQGDPLRVVS
jgi:glycerate dehydrogenase